MIDDSFLQRLTHMSPSGVADMMGQTLNEFCYDDWLDLVPVSNALYKCALEMTRHVCKDDFIPAGYDVDTVMPIITDHILRHGMRNHDIGRWVREVGVPVMIVCDIWTEGDREKNPRVIPKPVCDQPDLTILYLAKEPRHETLVKSMGCDAKGTEDLGIHDLAAKLGCEYEKPFIWLLGEESRQTITQTIHMADALEDV